MIEFVCDTCDNTRTVLLFTGLGPCPDCSTPPPCALKSGCANVPVCTFEKRCQVEAGLCDSESTTK